ncbi:MAG: TspO/MBR family protein [Rickettsiales bacterium]
MMTKSPNKYFVFLAFYALSFAVQAIGGYFTQLSVTTWYMGLNKSPLAPPGAAFGIAWTILYFLMALAATRIYRRTRTFRSHALRWWLVQLLLGFLWTVMFFGHREIMVGMQIIATNWIAVGITLYLFKRIDKVAAWMLAPLWAWLTFASYLNLYILAHN